MCTLLHENRLAFKENNNLPYLFCPNTGTKFRELYHLNHMRGWSGGAMVLGKLPVPGRPAYLE